MRKIVLIGGGDTRLETYETKEIDEKIVSLTNKNNPNLLFIGFASDYAEAYYDSIKKIYKKLSCNTSLLKKKNCINNKKLVEEKINNADIIYIGGGDTIKLLDTIEKYEIDKQIEEAITRGCVVAGISAGAIALCKEGYSDSKILRNESDKYCFIKGLDFVKISICPHYKTDSQKAKELDEEIESRKVYGLSNNTALVINDKKMSIIKSDNKQNIYLITKKKKEILTKEGEIDV